MTEDERGMLKLLTIAALAGACFAVLLMDVYLMAVL